MPKSGWSFISQTTGGELVMPPYCPEFGGGAGTRRGGVKAPEGWRSPRPGGLRGGLEHDDHPWGLHRRVSEADRGGDFVLQNIGGEMLTRRDCPEIGVGTEGGGRGVKAVEGNRTPSPGGITESLGEAEHSWGLRRGVDTAVGGLVGVRRMPEYPEWVWTAVSSDAGNEVVTCVESVSYRVVLAAGAAVGCHVRSFDRGAPNEGFQPWGGPLVCRFLGPLAPRNPVPSVPPPCRPSEKAATGRSETCPTRQPPSFGDAPRALRVGGSCLPGRVA